MIHPQMENYEDITTCSHMYFAIASPSALIQRLLNGSYELTRTHPHTKSDGKCFPRDEFNVYFCYVRFYELNVYNSEEPRNKIFSDAHSNQKCDRKFSIYLKQHENLFVFCSCFTAIICVCVFFFLFFSWECSVRCVICLMPFCCFNTQYECVNGNGKTNELSLREWCDS